MGDVTSVHSQSSLPWLCVGDFNEIISDEEKMGGALRPTRQMENFKQSLYDCNLHAVPIIGPFFTWSRGKGSNMILERLDRGVATNSWFAMFPTVCETHLVAPTSDHAPLLFHASNKQVRMGGYKKSFRFENMWV